MDLSTRAPRRAFAARSSPSIRSPVTFPAPAAYRSKRNLDARQPVRRDRRVAPPVRRRLPTRQNSGLLLRFRRHRVPQHPRDAPRGLPEPRCTRVRSASGSRIRSVASNDDPSAVALERRSAVLGRFGDIYHAPDGAAEVQRVFVDPQHLTERLPAARPRSRSANWASAPGSTSQSSRSATWNALRPTRAAAFHQRRKTSDRPARLRRTVAAAQRARCRSTTNYRACYPPSLPGWHRRHLAGGRITLSVFFGDGAAGFSDIVGRQRVADRCLVARWFCARPESADSGATTVAQHR